MIRSMAVIYLTGYYTFNRADYQFDLLRNDSGKIQRKIHRGKKDMRREGMGKDMGESISEFMGAESMNREPQLYVKANCINAEGPVWDERTETLYFIDVEAGKIFSYREGKLASWDAGEQIGCAVLCETGGMIAALRSGLYAVDFPDGGKQFLGDPEADVPGNRFNDGKVDPAGRLLAGTMALSAGEQDPPTGALYCLHRDGSISKVIDQVYLSNGLAWSADGSLFYFIDTTARTVTCYRYDVDAGIVSDPEIIIRVPGELGYPDGMTIDEDGNLWIALWGGGAVSKWDPETGELLETYALPVQNVSSCCFGGKEMDTLFITTASQGTDLKKYPLAGNVFCMKPGVRGAGSRRYQG